MNQIKENHLELKDQSVRGHLDIVGEVSTLKVAIISAIIGGALIFLTAIASPTTVHNIAHDTRHASGFPCH